MGAEPQGARDREQAAAAVRRMFTDIAARYDLLNHLLSLGVDHYWWWRTARSFEHVLREENSRILDLCCGTGDLTLALRRRAGKSSPRIIGADFSHAMLRRAARKSSAQNLRWVEADALRLPFADADFDLVVSSFGFRNLADYDAGLREMVRVLRRGGEVGILDFGQPRGFLGALYRVYFHRVLPALGTLISGVAGPYEYLPASVEHFPAPQEMQERMRAVGLSEVSWTPYTFRVAGLFRGRKL